MISIFHALPEFVVSLVRARLSLQMEIVALRHQSGTPYISAAVSTPGPSGVKYDTKQVRHDARLGLDCAARHFYDMDTKQYRFQRQRVSREAFIQLLDELARLCAVRGRGRTRGE